MPRRQNVIADSITYSVLHSDKKPGVLEKIPAFFYTYWLTFGCVREDLFKALRGTWNIDESDYRTSFSGQHALDPKGDMGYSGSTFFTTHDAAYLVKSVPRRFEHSFFRDDLVLPYAEHMQQNPSSLLVRITDFLEFAQYSIGSLLGLAPTHHIVMENIKYGEENAHASGGGENKWETWDLKPMSYFYPERDVAGGVLSSEATKSKLADDFREKIVLSLDQAEELAGQLEKDTRLLARCNAVDYSLFLIRIPLASSEEDAEESGQPHGAIPPPKPPFAPPGPPSWRTGIKSADGKFVYRAAVLDFFWAKHKVTAMAMTGLINTYNVVDKQGPMSVTTDAPEYRERFLKMCREIVEVR